ncbi:MAG: competence/damage-inducible protein A [Bacteroidales bacterium]|jgi:nicotinamide-nucleotide amidase|nr:competence/damage-inducible protein A [Bacteroidales bacterium]
MKAEIITIGDELLIGQVTDTNSSFIAKALNGAGIEVQRITSVSDTGNEIISALEEASGRVKLVLITGGLGPTKDDVTKAVIAQYMGDRLVSDPGTLQHIQSMMAARNIAMNPLNIKQAEVPEHAEVIRNSCGTAPGIWCEKDGTIYIFMPGVPFEMKAMMQDELLPRLQQRFATNVILHRTLLVAGIPESKLAIRIEQWENSLPPNIRLAYLPSDGMIRLRLSVAGSNRDTLVSQTETAIETLRPLLGMSLLSVTGEQPEELAGRLLLEKGKTVATAESCTGGNIACLLTSIAGSSAYFKGTVVAYANDVKTGVLCVNASDIDHYGAVSREVAVQMAQRVRQLIKTDYGIATTGIAGPSGGTPEKPVGTVWIAIAEASKTTAKQFHYGNIRENNIRKSSVAALNMLIETLNGLSSAR